MRGILYCLLPLSLSIPAMAQTSITQSFQSNPMLYGFGLLVIVMWILFQGIPLVKKLNRFTKAMTGKIYLNKSSTILQTQYRKLALGAIYSEQQTAFINSLTTGLEAAMIRTRLADWWGVQSRQDAISTLDYLHKKGFRFYTKAVLDAYSAPQDNQLAILESYFQDDEDLQKAWSQLQNLKETLEELKSDKIIHNTVDIKKLGTCGWDAGRLVFVARLCFDAEYISEEEAWSFIEAAHQLATNEFHSWDDYAKSYVIGRALWGGINSFNSGIASIAEYLLKKPESPWMQLKW
jgi:hypothetical protein